MCIRDRFHGAVIAHAGTENTRVFREVKQLGEELEKLSNVIPGTVNEAEVGVIFDWDNYWALEYTSGPSISCLLYTSNRVNKTFFFQFIVSPFGCYDTDS